MNNTLENSAVLFIDIINDFDFDGGEKLAQHTMEILPQLKKLRNFAKKYKLPIIYINDHYGLWQGDPDTIINYCRNDTSEPMIKALKPTPDDYFLMKPLHSAFFQTPFKHYFMSLEKHI